MGAADLFLSFEGRLDRGRWLAAAGLLVAGNVLVFALTWWLHGVGWLSGGARDLARTAAQAFTMVPWAALDWKRLHDLGRPGPLALACPGLFVLARVWEAPAVRELATAHAAVQEAIAWTQLLLGLVLTYFFVFKAGMPGPNRFGPDPSGRGDPTCPEPS